MEKAILRGTISPKYVKIGRWLREAVVVYGEISASGKSCTVGGFVVLNWILWLLGSFYLHIMLQNTCLGWNDVRSLIVLVEGNWIPNETKGHNSTIDDTANELWCCSLPPSLTLHSIKVTWFIKYWRISFPIVTSTFCRIAFCLWLATSFVRSVFRIHSADVSRTKVKPTKEAFGFILVEFLRLSKSPVSSQFWHPCMSWTPKCCGFDGSKTIRNVQGAAWLKQKRLRTSTATSLLVVCTIEIYYGPSSSSGLTRSPQSRRSKKCWVTRLGLHQELDGSQELFDTNK